MIEEHLKALQANPDYRESTVSSARAWLTNFQAFCGDRDPTELGVKDLEQWHKQLLWTPGPSGKLYSESSVNQAVGAVRRFYRWLLAEGKLKENPTRTLVTPQAKKTRTNRLILTGSQKRKVLSTLNLESPIGIRDRAVLGLLIETKISRPACSRIDRGHLCFDTGALLTKGRTQQIHSLGDALLADLHRYIREARPLILQESSPALFLDRYGNRLSAASVQQIVNRALSLAQL